MLTISEATDFDATHPLAGGEGEIDALRECGRLFHARGWSVGTSSNYSVIARRDPLELIVTASGKDKGRLARHDFVRIDGRGEPTSDGQPRSSAETMLHVVLAQRPEPVGCILHTHSVWSTILSQRYFSEAGLALEGYEMLKGLEGIATHEHRLWVPIFDNTQDIPRLADQVKRLQESHPEQLTHGFLIRRHGLYTWGRDVFSARRHVEIFEFLFECHARSNM
ncbi:MAG TPA: methylthioribulose 1-phosphate dehydratase [Pirellulaceae bacterium]|nr:methylthioribulose 1-phosphate dehydratase [Pirellulaceae bacterium]